MCGSELLPPNKFNMRFRDIFLPDWCSSGSSCKPSVTEQAERRAQWSLSRAPWMFHGNRIFSGSNQWMELFWPSMERAKVAKPLSVPILLIHQSQKVNQYTYSYRIYMQHWRILLWHLSPEPLNSSMCLSSLLNINFFCASHVWVNFKVTGRKQKSMRAEELDVYSLSSFLHLELRERLYCSAFAPNLHVDEPSCIVSMQQLSWEIWQKQ